jgi:hypothetical protein
VVTYALRLEPAQRVRIALRGSENLDALLEVRGPDGFSLTHDDVPGSLDAMVEFVPPSAGTYEVTATSANPRQTGPYLLAVSPRAPAVGVPLPPDGRVEGVYAPQTTDPDGFPGEWFHTEVRAGARLRVRANSRAFDTVLTVLGPRGERWTNDDANDTGPDGSERALDSTVEVAAPETGTYHVVVNAYGGGSGGPFRLTSRALPPVVLHPGQDTPSGGLAGPDGRGRVLGLYAGITNYERQSHLYGCADDARFLGQAFRASHLQGPSEQQVLTDGQVTRQAFLAGIDQLARRSTADDVVLVFFSGHGGTSPDARPGGDELSGLDATVVMQDGSITDDELVEHLSRVRARTVLLALDTCHAGGFADDWVRAPGRVGLFSSDADVLSDTAEPRGAGGYLSIHLRRGVLGDADVRPRDGVLQLGELTDFLHRGFVEDYRNMNPEGSQEPSQWLVASRGAVPWTEVLWAYPRGEDLALPPTPAVTLESPSIHGQ